MAMLFVFAALALGGSLAVAPSPAEAHGKELDITINSLIANSDQPLVRLYRAVVVFASDLDPVEGATVTLTGWLDRDGEKASELTLVTFTEIAGRPGLYVSEVTYDRFGTWRVSLQVDASLGQGSGTADFVEELAPGALTASDSAALRAEGDRVYRLQLLFGFDWWPDVANIVARIVHSIAGLAYFVATGMALALAWFGVPAGRTKLPAHLARVFPLAAYGSLAALLAAGLYSAAFGAPITAPGIFDLDRMRQIPYGEWYLAAFALKPILFVVLVLLAVRIAGVLSDWRAALTGSGRVDEAAAATEVAQPSAPPELRRLTLINAAVGVVLVADVAVLTYLHYVSHLGVFLPSA